MSWQLLRPPSAPPPEGQPSCASKTLLNKSTWFQSDVLSSRNDSPVGIPPLPPLYMVPAMNMVILLFVSLLSYKICRLHGLVNDCDAVLPECGLAST